MRFWGFPSWTRIEFHSGWKSRCWCLAQEEMEDKSVAPVTSKSAVHHTVTAPGWGAHHQRKLRGNKAAQAQSWARVFSLDFITRRCIYICIYKYIHIYFYIYTLTLHTYIYIYKTYVYFGWSVFLSFIICSIAGVEYRRTVQRFVVSLWCAKGKPVAVLEKKNCARQRGDPCPAQQSPFGSGKNLTRRRLHLSTTHTHSFPHFGLSSLGPMFSNVKRTERCAAPSGQTAQKVADQRSVAVDWKTAPFGKHTSKDWPEIFLRFWRGGL